MNVATLKEELLKRGIKPTSKHKKANMQKMLKAAITDSIFYNYLLIIYTIIITFDDENKLNLFKTKRMRQQQQIKEREKNLQRQHRQRRQKLKKKQRG